MDRLVVEVLSGDEERERPPAVVNPGMQILGLDISKGMLLVYDGSRAALYKVGGLGVVRLIAEA